jgi:hypothetical protein
MHGEISLTFNGQDRRGDPLGGRENPVSPVVAGEIPRSESSPLHRVRAVS